MGKYPSVQVNDEKQLQAMIEEFWNDRVGFTKHIIGATPSDQQGDVLKALDIHDHVSVKAGHMTGKTTLESWAILHYASTRYPFKIPCTAPSKHQLFDVLWSELSKWHKHMSPLFRDMFVWSKENFRHKDDPEECYAAARTASKDNPEALQGMHSDYVFTVVDEGSAVPDNVYEVLEGATGWYETKQLIGGNPTRLEGTFFDTFHKTKDFYRGLTMSCLKSPITNERYIARMKKKWGEDSNMYLIRVLGEFPMRDGDSFIPYHLAYDASIREIPPQDMFPKTFGCDIARYGDDQTVVAIRQGDEIKPLHILSQKSTMETANFIMMLARKEKPQAIFVDVIGVGAGVFDRLQEMGFPAVAVNVAESPAIDATRYRRLRDELWGQLRDWLELRRGRIHDNDDADLIGELTSPRYKPNDKGQIVIERKEDMKKRGKPSPNMADACCLTFAQPTAEYTLRKDDPFMEEMMAFYGQADKYRPFDAEAGY